MPRARNIKYETFTNDKLAELPFQARLLFIGLWTLADKEGRLEDRPKKIKAQLFPYDDLEVSELLQQLHKYSFITRYSVDEESYIQVNRFKKHQNPHKNEKDSEIPEPPVSNCKIETPEISGNYSTTSEEIGNARADSLLLITDSLLLIPDKQPNSVVASPKKKTTQISFPLPEWLNINDWNDYLDMRKARNKKPTMRALQLSILTLDELRKKGHDPSDVLKQSIMNGWTGLFEPKGVYNNGNYNNQKPNAHDNITRGIQLALSESAE